jgi:hypothetical protein
VIQVRVKALTKYKQNTGAKYRQRLRNKHNRLSVFWKNWYNPAGGDFDQD